MLLPCRTPQTSSDRLLWKCDRFAEKLKNKAIACCGKAIAVTHLKIFPSAFENLVLI
ncbi:hypothetical protein HCG51_21195 [Tolypothrix sp. PCC 7910]|uniref:hypothetical protein n=1 Tax=Tolypothrix sp. PCC 7910 TaxID=2099387 RepID=UPI00142772EC|nr:hypothetical protein [Tolypothrix sp. PCC 7910]QIR38967.1 hypothetical protein HCG51_21195 [Tolypothrix sp. PCC 7910]